MTSGIKPFTRTGGGGVTDAAPDVNRGHMSRKMLEHYSHVRLAAKRGRDDTLGGGLIAPEWKTTNPRHGH